MNASEGDPPAPPHDEDKAEQADEAAGSVVPDPANATETASRTNPIIVGVGASAGGLEALKAFLGGFPPAEHICIVVAQHMSPSRESLLRELLEAEGVAFGARGRIDLSRGGWRPRARPRREMLA